MARSMRDHEFMDDGLGAGAGVIEMAPGPAGKRKAEKGGAWLDFSSDHGQGRSEA